MVLTLVTSQASGKHTGLLWEQKTPSSTHNLDVYCSDDVLNLWHSPQYWWHQTSTRQSLASFVATQVDTRTVSMVRSTSRPSSTEVTSPFSLILRWHMHSFHTPQSPMSVHATCLHVVRRTPELPPLSRRAHRAQLKRELHHSWCRLHSASHAVLRNVKTHSSAPSASHDWHRNFVCFSRLVTFLSAVQALCNLNNLIGHVLELHRLDNAIKSTFGHQSPLVGFWPVFLQNFTHSSNHAPSIVIGSVTRAVGDDHAWETLLASGAIRHIHRRSPRRVCYTSTQATLRDSELYVSCGTSFHSCNQAFRHVFLTTCSATMFAVYLLSDPNGSPTAFLLFEPQCTGVLAATHWSALRSMTHDLWLMTYDL